MYLSRSLRIIHEMGTWRLHGRLVPMIAKVIQWCWRSMVDDSLPIPDLPTSIWSLMWSPLWSGVGGWDWAIHIIPLPLPYVGHGRTWTGMAAPGLCVRCSRGGGYVCLVVCFGWTFSFGGIDVWFWSLFVGYVVLCCCLLCSWHVVVVVLL